MKILLAAFGTRGDVQPMVSAGLRLRAEGHHVVVGASRGFESWVRGFGLDFHSVGGDLEPWIRAHDEMVSNPLRFVGSSVRYLRNDVRRSLDDTRVAAEGADLIVSGLHVAAPSVAELLGVPHVALLFCPQALRSRQHPPPGVGGFSFPRGVNAALWTVARITITATFDGPLERTRREWGLPPVRDMLEYLLTPSPILVSDASLGGIPAELLGTLEQTGSLAPATEGATDPALEHFLDDGPPPVYVGFGSMPDPRPLRTTRSIVEALEACGRRGVILAGWAGLGEGRLPAGVHVVRSASHATLLPRTVLAVHHGGAGTTAAVARAGVPQLVVPHCADQFYWGDQVHRRGLGGRPLARPSLTAARLAAAIRNVLERPELSRRAAEIAADLRGPDGGARLVSLLFARARVARRPLAA